MKNRLHIVGLLSLLCLTWVLNSCESNEKLHGVDLRYEESGKKIVEDLYVVDAKGVTTMEFRVKSDHPWKIYGSQDWYTISPSEGAANEVATVTITCKENSELDDRIDTIKIQSDYWVGKEFTLLQEGIAYLSTNVEGNTLYKDKEEGTASFNVIANQPWTVEVTEGGNWLSVAENSSGGEAKMDTETEVKLNIDGNNGEERTAKLTLYDRNRDEQTKVQVIFNQEGIVLLPIIPQDQQQFGYIRVTETGASELSISVESNGEWSVSKENESDDWYSFIDGDDFEGNAVVKLQLTENKGNAVRVANVLFSTKEVEGSEVITKHVTIKQANVPQPERTILDAGGIGSWSVIGGLGQPIPGDGGAMFERAGITKSGFKPGNFKMSMRDMNAQSRPYLHLIYKEADGTSVLHRITIGLNDPAQASKLWTFVTPWGFAGPQVANFVNNVNMTAPHTFGLNLTEHEGYIKIEYMLDDVVRHDYITNGKDRTSPVSNVPTYGAYVMPYDSEVRVELRCDNGSAFIEWFEYTPNIDWLD